VVRRHQTETEHSVTFVLDASADMGTGAMDESQRPALRSSKFGAAITLIASMAMLIHRRGDRVGLVILGGEGVPSRWMPPRLGRTHLREIFESLAGVIPAGGDVLATGFADVGKRLRSRAMVVVVSDLMEEPDKWGPQLSALVRRKTDLRVAHLYDDKEIGFDYKKTGRFFSPEGGRALAIDPRTIRSQFAEVVADYFQEVDGWMASKRAVCVRIPSDTPLDRPIRRLMMGV